jgi:hypothetical protein
MYASTEEIRSMFGTLPDTLRMSADIASRIDAPLAAEIPVETSTQALEAKTTASSGGASRPEHDKDSGVHVSRETSPAMDRPTGHSRAATGPGQPDRTRRVRRRTVVLGMVLAAATLGLGTLLVRSSTNLADAPAKADSQEAATSTFSGDTLKNQVAKLLSQNQTRGQRFRRQGNLGHIHQATGRHQRAEQHLHRGRRAPLHR